MHPTAGDLWGVNRRKTPYSGRVTVASSRPHNLIVGLNFDEYNLEFFSFPAALTEPGNTQH